MSGKSNTGSRGSAKGGTAANSAAPQAESEERPLATAILHEFKNLRDKLKNDEDSDVKGKLEINCN